MSAIATEILSQVAGALVATGSFEQVCVGTDGSSVASPRATVVYEGQDCFQPDDSPARWARLRARIVVRVRSEDVHAGVAMAIDLCSSAAQQLLKDRYRGGRCCDLPIGRATEIGSSELAHDVRRPAVEMSLPVRFHFELPLED